MTAPTITIDYYVSMNSPWVYLGGQAFLNLVAKTGVTVRTKPTKFAEVFAATGGLPLPKRAPERQAYRLMELKRWRDRRGAPINIEPQYFPADETAGARAVIAAASQGYDAARLTLEIGREVWERDTNIAEEAVLATAAKRAEIPFKDINVKDGDHGHLDEVWEANTTEAIARGVFGAPSYVFDDGEIFWGQDRLSFVEAKLKALIS
ncbi:MAG: 2-hydroxychromene-2-carboxylate isomerase [Pseudomonadota bacterium]